jgi:hypothetical protein
VAVPRDPIAAVTHADPHPYYAELVARTPLYRPPAEPVLAALLGSPAADIFRHATFKPAVAATLGALDAGHVTEHAQPLAQSLLDETRTRTDTRIPGFATRGPREAHA